MFPGSSAPPPRSQLFFQRRCWRKPYPCGGRSHLHLCPLLSVSFLFSAVPPKSACGSSSARRYGFSLYAELPFHITFFRHLLKAQISSLITVFTASSIRFPAASLSACLSRRPSSADCSPSSLPRAAASSPASLRRASAFLRASSLREILCALAFSMIFSACSWALETAAAACSSALRIASIVSFATLHSPFRTLKIFLFSGCSAVYRKSSEHSKFILNIKCYI